MKRRFTLLSLVLFITVLGFTQQTDIEYNLQNDFQNQHFDDEYVTFNKKDLKNATPNLQSLDSLVYYHWDLNTSEWTNSSRRLYTYETNEALEVFSTWNSNTDQWEKSSKYNETFDDASGNLTLRIQYNWDSTTDQWVNYKKREYTLNENGRPTLGMRYNWDSDTNQWINNFKGEYTLDTYGNILLIINQNWDSDISQWVNNGKNEYIRNVNGTLLTYFFYTWNSNTSQWKNQFKSEYIYDADGNRTSRISQDWDSDINQWINHYKYEYSYDSNGNRILEIKSTWDSDLSEWINSNKYESTLDLSINTSNLITPWYYPYYNSNKILTRSTDHWNETTNEWEIYSNLIYYYSESTASVNQLSNNGLELYPNPVSNILNINIQDNVNQAVFELFDVQGKKVITQKFYSKEQTNLKHLNAGLYIYTITIDGNEKRGKLIKK